MSDKKKFTVHTGGAGNAAPEPAPNIAKAFAEIYHILELEKTAAQVRHLAYEKMMCKYFGLSAKEFSAELSVAIADVEDSLAGLVTTPLPIEMGDFVRLDIQVEGSAPQKGLIAGVGSGLQQSAMYQALEQEILGKCVGAIVTLKDNQGKVARIEVVRVSRH